MSRSFPKGTLSKVEQFSQTTVVVALVDEFVVLGFVESRRMDVSSHPQTIQNARASASAR